MSPVACIMLFESPEYAPDTQYLGPPASFADLNLDQIINALAANKADLSTVRYCLLIKDNCVSVREHKAEIDYSVEVEETFAFRPCKINTQE